MSDSTFFDAGVNSSSTPSVPSIVLGRERLLGVPDICQLTGLGEVTASRLMKESGRCLKLHGRLYVIDTSFFAYLHSMEGVDESCSL